MEGDHIKINRWLTPFSWLYGFGVFIRNAMFDCGMLPSEKFDVPVISVGNISVGGSGKTPHTEYLVSILKDKYQVAVLSRGYKRKSKGFQLAVLESRMEQIGDEPYQMKHKYPDVHVAVDADRRNGIRKLLSKEIAPPVDVVILDDAFQHRYVTPSANLLLMDYHRLICFDKLLPAGRLREHVSNKRRADVVIVTKCPQSITPMEQRGIERSLGLYPWQRIYFTYFKYGNLYPLFDKSRDEMTLDELGKSKRSVLLLTGIASPEQMEYDVSRYVEFTPMHFGDHHNFTNEDLVKITEAYKGLKSDSGIIVTTEKDSVRLLNCGLDDGVAKSIYVLPVEIGFINGKTDDFNKTIIDYVRKNSRNSAILKRKNDRKT